MGTPDVPDKIAAGGAFAPICRGNIFEVKKSYVVLLLVLVSGLLVVDGVLLRENKSLTLALRGETASLAPTIGMLVPALDGISSDGTAVSIGYKGEQRATLLFVFSTECSICTKNWPRWEALARQIDSTRYRVVYANLSHSLKSEYLSAHHLLGSTVLAEVDPKSQYAYNLSLTPAVLMISPAGQIYKTWLGLSKESDLRDLERTLHITPGTVTIRSDGP